MREEVETGYDEAALEGLVVPPGLGASAGVYGAIALAKSFAPTAQS